MFVVQGPICPYPGARANHQLRMASKSLAASSTSAPELVMESLPFGGEEMPTIPLHEEEMETLARQFAEMEPKIEVPTAPTVS